MTRSHMLLGAWQIGDLQIDLPKLLETTMLVQSYSGAENRGHSGGCSKEPGSYCPRRGACVGTRAGQSREHRRCDRHRDAGRRRGLSLIAAAQRLSKLHRDVAAELLNKLIDRTGLDVDVRRAADELGMTGRDAMAALRDLSPGEFFAFGPALTRSVTKVVIGAVQTTHSKVGDRLAIRTPAPSRKVIAVLQTLADIPREAIAEAVTPRPVAR